DNENLMRNDGAKEGCYIFLTKPIGIGILSTAQKQKVIEDGHVEPSIKAMVTLNKIGAKLAPLSSVLTMTDVTGFGLLGHLSEICEASDISATLWFDKVPLLPNVEKYRAMGCVPGGTRSNFLSYGHKISTMSEPQREILCDAQTSGGLLILVEKSGLDEFLRLSTRAGLDMEPIGETHTRGSHLIEVL
ncbi:MAG TPA: selenide, water dikinase SelD, partial [Sulfurovum sp.]|nr:selenide, water dikinase SelD [Sulfurovum sp.]